MKMKNEAYFVNVMVEWEGMGLFLTFYDYYLIKVIFGS